MILKAGARSVPHSLVLLAAGPYGRASTTHSAVART